MARAAPATVLWLGLFALFRVSTSNTGRCNETCSGIMILLLWLSMTAFVVQLCVEIRPSASASSHAAGQPARSAQRRSVCGVHLKNLAAATMPKTPHAAITAHLPQGIETDSMNGL
jgi:ABC-type uncharacterized transport system permease subunit